MVLFSFNLGGNILYGLSSIRVDVVDVEVDVSNGGFILFRLEMLSWRCV